MLIVDHILVSEDLIDEQFCCDLSQCAGACCIEGDAGAPIAPDEVGDLEDNFPIFRKYMTAEGVAKVEADGTFDYDMEGEFATPLLSDEACAYVYYENGIAKCAIEKAFLNGEIDFQKPISCHLYPIRVKQLPDYEALNYHRWAVCTAACSKGLEKKIPVYQFLKAPLTRKYGAEWYKKLEQSVQEMKKKEQK